MFCLALQRSILGLLFTPRLPYRLRKQELARGAASQDMDFGVERLMQQFKTCTGRKMSQNTEKAFVNVMLLDQAMQAWRRDMGEQAYARLIKDPGLTLMQGRMYDNLSPVRTGPQVLLLGMGRPLRSKLSKEEARADPGGIPERQRVEEAMLQVSIVSHGQ